MTPEEVFFKLNKLQRAAIVVVLCILLLVGFYFLVVSNMLADIDNIHRQIAEAVNRRYLSTCRQQVHKKLAAHCAARMAENRQASGLQEYTYHLLQAGERQQLYSFVTGKDFLADIIDTWEQYGRYYTALHYGIQAHVAGDSPEDTFRLCHLVLRTGEFFTRARSDISHVFKCAEAGNIKITKNMSN